MPSGRAVIICAIAVLAPVASVGATAGATVESYPRKPIRMIVPFVRDTGTDVLARTIALPLSVAWNEPMVVDNRPGMGGMSGLRLAAAAAPDGYTLVLANVAALALAPAMQNARDLDPMRDLAPITQLAATANVMLANPSLGVTTPQQLIAFARAQPGVLRYASGGSGTAGHLAGELLESMTQIVMTHVPYAGSPAAMRGILGGEAGISFTSLVSSLPHVRSGKLRALAVTSLERVPVLPDVPTLDESGVKQFEVSGWQAVLAPAGTSMAIRTKLQRAISEILNAPDVSARMAGQGLTIVASPPAQFGEYLASEVSKWGELIRRLRLNTERSH